MSSSDSDEKKYHDNLCHRIGGHSSGDGKVVIEGRSEELRRIQLVNPTSDRKTLYDLVGDRPYRLFCDHSDWNQNKQLMVNVIGGCTPDLVLRSALSNENRIYIEVKATAPLGYPTGSQMVRYFLHLLAMSQEHPPGVDDVRRAVVLAASSSWLRNERLRAPWLDFRQRYAPIANEFGITIAEIVVDHLGNDAG